MCRQYPRLRHGQFPVGILESKALTISDSNLKGCAYAPPRATTQVHTEPAEVHRSGAEAAAGDKKQREILYIMMHGFAETEEDAVAAYGDEHGDHGKDISDSKVV